MAKANMLVRQSKNTFIRFIEEKGYITNQMTRHDRSYNETGADFLKEISRQPQDVEDIVARLSHVYDSSVSIDELRSDFGDFINDLAEHLFWWSAIRKRNWMLKTRIFPIAWKTLKRWLMISHKTPSNE